MRLICNRTQNDAIWELIALFLTNQIAGNTIDFKMNVINLGITSCSQHNVLNISSLNFLIQCPKKRLPFEVKL